MPRGVTSKTPERVAQARSLRAEGKKWSEIAEIMGIAVSTTHAWTEAPETRKARRDRYRGKCVDCGKATDSSKGPGKAPERCHPCRIAFDKVWTPDAVVCAIQQWADEHGGVPPTANDFLRARVTDLPYPCSNTVQREMGSWNNAIRAAGYEPHAQGPVGGFTELTDSQRRECARRYAAGESTVQISADFGCSPAMVAKWARRFGAEIRPTFGRREAA